MTEKHEIVKKEEMAMIGLCIETDFDHCKEQIPLLWERFLREKWGDKIPNKKSDDIIVLYSDYDKDYKGSYLCTIGCEVKNLENIPKEMRAKKIPASTYAHLQAKGEYPKSLGLAWNEVWESKLDRTYLGDFEVYGKNFYNAVPEVEIFVAVKAPVAV